MTALNYAAVGFILLLQWVTLWFGRRVHARSGEILDECKATLQEARRVRSLAQAEYLDRQGKFAVKNTF